MRARDRGRAFGQIVALGAALAVICTAAPGTASAQPAAQQHKQQQQPQQKRVLKIYVVGDSYSSGEGIRAIGKTGRGEANSYFDAQDPRHQSKLSAAVQAAARLQAANPDVKVEVHVVASSGATTSDVFQTQRRDALDKSPGNRLQDPIDMSTWHDSNDLAVSTPQIDQIGEDAGAVILGIGGNDALFGPLASALVYDETAKIAKLRAEIDRLLDTGQSDEAYRQQALDTKPGHAPTLVARLVQVMRAIKDRAPGAKLFIQNYPIAVDPAKTSRIDMLDGTDMQDMEQLANRLNRAIERAAEICGCGQVVDLSRALAGRELNSGKPAINDVFTGYFGEPAEWPQNEPVHPNRMGAGLMADHVAEAWAREFGLKPPARLGDRQSFPSNITVSNSPAPDTDGDGVPDYRDRDWDDDRVRNNHDTRPETPDGPVHKRSKESFDPPKTRPRGSGEQSSQPPRTRGGQSLPQAPPQASPPQSPQGQEIPQGRGGRPPVQQPPQPSPPQPDGQPQQPTQPRPEGQPQPRPPQQPSPPRTDDRPSPQPPQSEPPRQQPPRPQPPRPPSPQPPSPQKPSQEGKDTSSGSGKKQQPASRPKPVIQSSTAMRSSASPSIPKPPSAPSFSPNFGPKGSPPPGQLGGGLLGVKPVPPPVSTVPSKPGPSKLPLGGGKPTGAKPSGGALTPPLPTKAPGMTPPLPTKKPSGGGSGPSSVPMS